MKRSQSNNARPRTRFSRSASASSRKPGWKMSISIILGGTLLLVSVFFLLARLGGFGSRSGTPEKSSEEESWIRGEPEDTLDEFDDPSLKLFEKLQDRSLVSGENRERIDLSDEEEDENSEFEALDLDRKPEDVGEDDDPGLEELSGSKDEDEDEDEESDEELPRNKTEQELGRRSNETSKKLERLGQIKTLSRSVSNSSGEKFLWDKVLGVIKMPLENKKSGSPARKLGFGRSFTGDEDLLDDENEAGDVEDALFLRRDRQHTAKIFGGVSSQKPVPLSNVLDNKLARKLVKPPFDPSNPTGNFLLQDPDTSEPWGLTKSDKAISRVFRRGEEEQRMLSEKPRRRLKGDTRKWGAFPGLDPMLVYSDFMEEFLVGEKCQVRVFMAWISPPWAFTVRHQRGLESLLHFHPRACVVVFSETLELNFFKKFWSRGFRVSVVRPNLEELLEGTPAEMFASVWLEWRKIDLFHVHYSELLRLAALYKYGGLYLDSDVIVLKPLTSLHNVVGLEILPNGTKRINGAVMAFDKQSLFMRACLEEYTSSYDDKLLDWNGADLLTRVATRFNSSKGDELRVVAPSWFFPVSSSEVVSYFEEGKVLQQLEDSYTIHLWNRESGSLIPERTSVVGALIEQNCIWCDEIL